ncbi:MAG: hypothetical protein ACI9IA_000329 [Enterobacterales bacterium]|jgi:membrane protein implicated in regulation of membrane protease activity
MDSLLKIITTMDFIDWGVPGIILFGLHFLIKSEVIKWSAVGALIVSVTALLMPDVFWTIQWITFFVFFILGLYLNRGASV